MGDIGDRKHTGEGYCHCVTETIMNVLHNTVTQLKSLF